MSLILYSTSGCHLCELAEAQLEEARETYDFQWVWTEIADCERLMEQYSVRIPVVMEPETGQELSWPFDQAQLQSWLSQIGSPSL